MNKTTRSVLRKMVSAAKIKISTAKVDLNDLRVAVDDANKTIRKGKVLNNETLTVLHNSIHDGVNMDNCQDCLFVSAEILASVPGAPTVYVRPDQIPTFVKLLNVLNDSYIEEENSIRLDKHPSANDIKRWALKKAVLQYYQNLGIDSQEKVTDVAGSLITRHDLAPNKEKIYTIWINILDNQTRAEDKYLLNYNEYDEDLILKIQQMLQMF